MPKPFDAATRLLSQGRPDDWVAFLGLPSGAATVLDADLSTVSLAADRLLRVDNSLSSYILHMEFETGKSTAAIPFRLLQYSVQTKAKFALPVVSVVFLLHKPSDSPAIIGRYEETGPDGSAYLSFAYRAVRVWTQPAESFLTGGLSLLPLAPVSDVSPSDLPRLIGRMEARVEAEITDEKEAEEFWATTYILLGLRYDKAVGAQLLRGVRRMKESSTYQAIIEEGVEKGIQAGRLTEARRLVLRAATRRLGEPSESAQASLEAIGGVEALEVLHDRIFEVETWDELLTG